MSHHSRPTFLASIFGGFAMWWSQIRKNYLPFFLATQVGQKQGRGQGDSRFDLAH
jgi:hypothetical protein